MVIAKPGSITPHTEFEGEVYVLTEKEGGRKTPFFAGYRPQFYVRTTDVTGTIKAFTSDDGKRSGNGDARRSHQGDSRTDQRDRD